LPRRLAYLPKTGHFLHRANFLGKANEWVKCFLQSVKFSLGNFFLQNWHLRIGKEPICSLLAVGTKAIARRSERTSRTDVQLVLLKRRGTSWRVARSRNCRSEQESAWRCAISVLRGKLRHALLFFERTRRHSLGETVADLFTRRRSASLVADWLSPCASLPIRDCAAVLKRRCGRGGLSTELVESFRIVTIYFLDVSAS